MAVKSKQRHIASSQTANMSTGRADDFNGTVVKARTRFVQPKSGKNAGQTIPCLRLDIQPDEDSGFDIFSQTYFLGPNAKDYFAPSAEGWEGEYFKPEDFDPEDAESCEGLFFYPLNAERQKIFGASDYGFLTKMLEEIGFDTAQFDGDGGVSNLEGFYAHWNQREQSKRAGQAPVDGDKGKVYTTLVPTEAKTAKKAGGKGAPAAKASGKKAAAADDTEVREALGEFIQGALGSAKNNALTKAKVAAKVISGYDGPDKKTAISLVDDDDFLGSIDGVSFDSDSGILSQE